MKSIDQSFWKIVFSKFQLFDLSKFILTAVIMAVIVHIIFMIYSNKMKKQISIGNELLVIITICYIGFIFALAIFSRVPNSQSRIFQTKHLWWDENPEQNITNILSIVMFIPLGCLIELIGEKRNEIKRFAIVVAISFIMSFVIEQVNYKTGRGYFEVDNMEANVLGAFLGWLVIFTIFKIVNVIKSLTSRSYEEDNREGIENEER